MIGCISLWIPRIVWSQPGTGALCCTGIKTRSVSPATKNIADFVMNFYITRNSTMGECTESILYIRLILGEMLDIIRDLNFSNMTDIKTLSGSGL